MQAARALRYVKAPLAVTAAGLWAASTPLQRRTASEPATENRASARPVGGPAQGVGDPTREDEANASPFPPPVGPMVAVFLDESSVDKLKARYPDARAGQLRKVVLQYGPSASLREVYRHLFSSTAEVRVTGEASSFGRRALVASVSHQGDVVEPTSLSSAIDISPPASAEDQVSASPEDGPGPLASAVLVEQVKRIGATNKESWQGMLPPLSAHSRQFPREEGAYTRLEEPISVRGTICRADWVDGASTRCRDTLDGGKREEDWTPSACSICAMFEVTPCKDIFNNRFVAASKKHDEHVKAVEARRKGEAGTGQARERSDGQEDGANTGDAPSAARDKDSTENRAEDQHPGDIGKDAVRSTQDEDIDIIGAGLEAEVQLAFRELAKCMEYHDMR